MPLTSEDKAAQDIPISTTDTLPEGLGGSREVKRMRIAEIWGCETMVEAEVELRDWVRENSYDAVIGVRLL
jgi:hypothetical protein